MGGWVRVWSGLASSARGRSTFGSVRARARFSPGVSIRGVEQAMSMLVPSARDMVGTLVCDYPDIDVCVRAVAWGCWRCGRTSPAFGFVHVDDFTGPDDVIDVSEGLELEYVRDLLTLVGSPLASTIKVRASRTAGTSYLSSGCFYCDALFGAFPIREALTDIRVQDAVDNMLLILREPRPQLEVFLLEALRNAAI